MTDRKLTPQEAWEHVKALWFDADVIYKRIGDELVDGVVQIKNCQIPLKLVNIDWPDGVDRWPPKDKFRDPYFPGDWGKTCRCVDPQGREVDAILVGMYFKAPSDRMWIVDLGISSSTMHVSECKIRIDPNAKPNAIATPDPIGYPIANAPKLNNVFIDVFMGGRWIEARWSQKAGMWISHGRYMKTIEWDAENQPTRCMVR